MSDSSDPKIYVLPNLMTAGNLFCGFLATSRILEGAILQAQYQDFSMKFYEAIYFILGACVFDLLDGRVARMGGNESPFGREFDSLADIVSFGIAPALMVHQIVLKEFTRVGWLFAFFYLLCGGMRLARFNCLAASGAPGAGKDFKGFPIPAAAGVISSITLWMLWLQEGDLKIGNWKYALPALMLFLSWMMFSKVSYPSFKSFNLRTKKSIPVFFLFVLVCGLTYVFPQLMPMLLFCSYLIYGFVRPWLSKGIRNEVELEGSDAVVEADALLLKEGEPPENSDADNGNGYK